MEIFQIALLVALASVFVGVAVVVGASTMFVFARHTPERQRLRRMTGPDGTSTRASEEQALVIDDSKELRKTRTYVPKSPREVSRLRRRLMRAGYTTVAPLVVYVWAEVLLPLAGASAVLWYFGTGGWLIAFFVAVLLYLVPGMLLARKTSLRKQGLQDGLPDALDLLIVCVESGSSLDQGILKTSEELDVSYPALADELKAVNIEIRAGKPRLEAFRNLASRTGLEDVRALVAMLAQTDRFGTSVAQALRAHAKALRSKRKQRAEERAAKIGVKLVFPLVFFLFPAFYVVTLGPAVIQFVRVFFGQVVNGP